MPDFLKSSKMTWHFSDCFLVYFKPRAKWICMNLPQIFFGRGGVVISCDGLLQGVWDRRYCWFFFRFRGDQLIWYCWRFRNPGSHQLRLVVYPIIARVLAPSQVGSRIPSINSIPGNGFPNLAGPCNPLHATKLQRGAFWWFEPIEVLKHIMYIFSFLYNT